MKASGAELRHTACIVLCCLAVVSCSFDSAPILDPRNGTGGGAANGGGGGAGGSAADGGSGGRTGSGGAGAGGESG
ncbi:MAG TPA: hypothetical protein VJR89_08830, partial [Polyangiales bacterium]|nr:hypothetical protein [Polyangiales bacterium]